MRAPRATRPRARLQKTLLPAIGTSRYRIATQTTRYTETVHHAGRGYKR